MASNSWEDAADLSAALGVPLDGWQEDVLAASLGERRGGFWAATQVGLSAPRQNGKSQLIVARFIAGALLFGEKKIIVSAHQQDTARETFAKFLEIYDENEALRKRVKSIMNALNRESITFTNGAKVQFKARSGSGGRGFSCDCLLLDEAQILSQRVWVSINSTMSARPNPQVWLLGTPPTPDDDGEVFGRIRQAAVDGKSSRLTYLEWAADASDDPALERTRWKANPAWNTRINHEVVQGEFETYSKEDFARDRLGIWDEEQAKTRAIRFKSWASLEAPKPADGVVAFGVKFSPDGSTVALAAAIRPKLGPVHIEGFRQANTGEGLGWLVDFLVARKESASLVVIDGKAGTGALVDALRERGMRNKKQVLVAQTDQAVAAHSMLAEAITSGTISHISQKQLDDQVKDAVKRVISKTTGSFGWAASDGGPVPLLDAATLAFWGARTTRRVPGRKAVPL